MLHKAFSAFLANRSGNFGMMVALLTVPLIGVVGVATDYSAAISIRTALQAAADAAAVGAISDSSAGQTGAFAMAGNGTIALGADEAKALFKGDFVSIHKDVDPEITATVTKNGRDISSEVTYTLDIPTTFMGILGVNSIHIAGQATAASKTGSFVDFYMLLDNTPSMGVGATPADVAKLVAATPDQCGFACHIVSLDGVEDLNSRYYLARKIGATIRIDVVALATAALFTKAASQTKYANQYRVATYTFGKTAADSKLLEVTALTADLAEARNEASGIQLMSIPYNNYNNDQLTSFDDALKGINSEIGSPGSGAGSNDAEKVLFFVTDGVGDSYKPTGCTKKVTGGRCQEPIDQKKCDQLKNRGVRIAILYTTYLPLPTNSWYNTWIAPFQDQIGPQLQACATPGFYFEVSPTQGISDAMKALFYKVIQSPRLVG